MASNLLHPLGSKIDDSCIRYATATMPKVFRIVACVVLTASIFINLEFFALMPLSLLLFADGILLTLAVALLCHGITSEPLADDERYRVAYWTQTLTCLFAGTVVFAFFAIFSHVRGYQQDLILACYAGIAISAGLVLSPLLIGAMGYTALAGSGITLATWMSFGSTDPQIPLLLLGYTAVMALACRLTHGLFTNFVRTEQQIRDKNHIISVLLREFEENSSDLMWQTDRHGCLTRPPEEIDTTIQAFAFGPNLIEWIKLGMQRADASQGDFLRLAAATATLKPFRDVILPVESNAGTRWIRISGKPIFDRGGLFTGYRGLSSDVTDSRLSEQRIAHLARHDSLTDLPNRHFLQDKLSQTFKTERRFSFLFLDLDGFKAVNDTYGHDVGDRLLRAVADRLRACIARDDMAARLGGDEFVILREGRRDAAETLAETVLAQLSSPYRLTETAITIGVSIGIAEAPHHGSTPAELMKHADMALYRAKTEGRGRWRWFEPEMATRSAAPDATALDPRRGSIRRQSPHQFRPVAGLSAK